MLICASALALAGCGGGEGGVVSGATVSAYVVAPLCAAAREQLARSNGRAGKVMVRAVCLPNPSRAGKPSLATIGANARRASEDSTTIGYLQPSDPLAERFSVPILESAEIPAINASSGKIAMARLLRALREAGSPSRASVGEALG
jgi:hypothetical protein